MWSQMYDDLIIQGDERYNRTLKRDITKYGRTYLAGTRCRIVREHFIDFGMREGVEVFIDVELSDGTLIDNITYFDLN